MYHNLAIQRQDLVPSMGRQILATRTKQPGIQQIRGTEVQQLNKLTDSQIIMHVSQKIIHSF